MLGTFACGVLPLGEDLPFDFGFVPLAGFGFGFGFGFVPLAVIGFPFFALLCGARADKVRFSAALKSSEEEIVLIGLPCLRKFHIRIRHQSRECRPTGSQQCTH